MLSVIDRDGRLSLAAVSYREWARTIYLMIGTALCAGGVAALNQWMESGPSTL